MTRPTPARPADLTAARLVAAEDALGAVRALDSYLLTVGNDSRLLEAQLLLGDLRLELARRVEVVVVEGLGVCDLCGEDVRAGTECSECLEDNAVVRHARCDT